MKKQNSFYLALPLLLLTASFSISSFAENKGSEKPASSNKIVIPEDTSKKDIVLNPGAVTGGKKADSDSKVKFIEFDARGLTDATQELLDLEKLKDPRRVQEIVAFIVKNRCTTGFSAMISTLNLLLNALLDPQDARMMTQAEYQSFKYIHEGLIAITDKAHKEIYDSIMEDIVYVISDSAQAQLAAKEDYNNLTISKNKRLREMMDIVNNPYELPEIRPGEEVLLLEYVAKSNMYADKKKEVRDVLERALIGQPELIEALVELRAQGMLMSGKFASSPRLYLMGSPKSGKSTAVKSYVKAIHPQSDDAIDRHLFEVSQPVTGSQSFNKLMGSSNGYMGSDEIPPFIQFLIDHSCGRYEVVMPEPPQKGYAIYENPNWLKEIDPTISCPEDGVIHFKNIHLWSQDYKDTILKPLLKDGTIELQQNAGGVFKIHVPITVIVSSNEGNVLLTTRDQRGQRRGYSYTKEQVQARYNKIHKDEEHLKNAIRSSSQKSGSESESQVGTSEDLLQLFTSRIHLLRPLEDNDLEKLTQLKIDGVNKKLQDAKIRAKLILKPNPDFYKQIIDYKLDPELASASIDSNVENFVQLPLLKFLTSTEELINYKGDIETEISIIENADGTKSLKLNLKNEGFKGQREHILPIDVTNNDKAPAKLSKERIQFWSKLPDTIQQKVFGIPRAIAEKVANAFMLSEDRGLSVSADEHKREGALMMAFLGLSSTGKSELTGVLSEATLGHRAARFVIDFNQIKTQEDLKAKILGMRDLRGRCKPSDFLEMYSRSNGELMVVFEEMANAPRELLKATYDILREPIVTTFCDGVPRSMKQVKIIITGNAGEEIFQGIPSNIHPALRAMMWQQFYNYFMQNKFQQRMILQQYFSQAQINRMGDDNINFMPPLSFQSRWELIQLKIAENLKSLHSEKGRHGWKVAFETEQDLKNFMEVVDEEGFTLEEQGASIDRYVKNVLDRDLRALLMKSMLTKPKLGDESTILLKFDKVPEIDKDYEGEQKTYRLKAFSADKTESAELTLTGQKAYKIAPQAKEEVMNTAVHEIGHLVSTLYVSKNQYPTYVTILPGVAQFGSKMGMYLGLAVSDEHEKVAPTREWVIENLARMLGGYVAEKMFFGVHTMGVSSDFERAAAMAQKVILKTGFSKAWGIQAIPDEMSMPEFLASLPEKDKERLKVEINLLLQEAEEKSRIAIQHSVDIGTFQKFAALLAQKGHVNEKDIEEIKAQANESKASFWSKLPDWIKPAWVANKVNQVSANNEKARVQSVLAELNKGDVTTIENLIDREISSQRAKALRLEIPIAKKVPEINSQVDLTAIQKGCEEFLKN